MEEHKHDCDVHAFKLDEHDKRLDKIDIILDKIRNRLPIWATIALGGLLAIIGYLVKGI